MKVKVGCFVKFSESGTWFKVIERDGFDIRVQENNFTPTWHDVSLVKCVK